MAIFFLFNLKFSGYFNFGLKIKKKYSYDFGFINLLFFLSILRLNGIIFTFNFFKKKTFNSVFIKSNIRYKVSKHSVCRISNRFFLKLYFDNTIVFGSLLKFLTNSSMLSCSILNPNLVTITSKILNKKFFNLYC